MYNIPFVKHVIISGGSKVTAVTAGLGREVQRMQLLQRSGGAAGAGVMIWQKTAVEVYCSDAGCVKV